jgi:hypothetical protein
MRLWDRYIAESLESRLLLSVDAQSTAGAAPGAFAGMPAVFVPNQGQWDEAIDLAAHGSGADILFTDTGPTFRIVENHLSLRERSSAQQPGEGPSTTRVTVTEWSLTFLDAARVAPVGIDKQPTVFNYYLGNDPSAWRSNVSSFAGVVYRDLWPGIDAHVLAQDDGMKYEFHLDPGADPQDIALRYEGVQGLSLNKAGGMSIRTRAGKINDDAPIAWQTRRDGTRADVAAEFVLLDAFTYTVSPTGEYDSSLPLVLDPQLVFGSFLGGIGIDSGNDIAPDGAGGAWVTGTTSSADFPTPGGFDTTLNGTSDVLVAHITAAGALAFASYLGGANQDGGYGGIAADGAGGAWVTGETFSSNFPTPGGFDTTLTGTYDGFVAHVNADGALTFGSYLGGVDRDHGRDLAPDGAGGVWVTGFTSSPDFPTPGGFDTNFTANTEGFVARVTAAGTLAYGSFLGIRGNGVAPDGAGGVWVTGSNFSGDVYVAHVAAGGTLAFSGYFGGSGVELPWGLAPDGAGGAWVTGWTDSSNFPTPGGFDTSRDGTYDAFVARVSAGGTLAYGSYLGGSSVDQGSGLAPDGAGGVWVTGDGSSGDFPTPGGFDTTYNGGRDAFVARVTAGGTLAFGSYLGGRGDDYGGDVAPDGAGGVWVTGETGSADFPTPGGFDTTHNGGMKDAFVARISEDTTPPTVTTSQFAFESAPQSIRITFSENVSASLDLDDLTLENLTTGQTIPSSNLALSYNTASNIATITFPGYEYGALPDGTYRATLLASGVTDPAGNPLAANHVLNFFFMQGDADHNGVIDGDDYAIIDNGFNFGLSGFINGDLNYDGVIDGDDYAIIDFAFNTQ